MKCLMKIPYAFVWQLLKDIIHIIYQQYLSPEQQEIEVQLGKRPAKFIGKVLDFENTYKKLFYMIEIVELQSTKHVFKSFVQF